MNDLNALLDHAAGPATVLVDARADLTRGHRALTRTRRRRGAAGLVGVAAAGVVGLGAARYAAGPEDTLPETAIEEVEPDNTEPDNTGVSLLAQPFEAGPFTFDAAPEGWEVQGAMPQGVTIAPEGFPDQVPLSFTGKLVIMFDGNPLGQGEQVDVDGRTFVFSDSGDGYTTISTQTRPDEPVGIVRIQYPAGTGWTRDTMIEFLAGVHVGPDAQPGLG